MPGKPRRDVTFDRILTRHPHVALNLGKKKVKLSLGDRYEFSLSIITGLLKRISLRNPEEENALWESLPRLEQRFAARVLLGDRSEAIEEVVIRLSKLSIPQLRRRLIQPEPLDLIEEAAKLERELPPKIQMKIRRAWAEQYGIKRDNAAESDSVLVEQILARKYRISESRVHKILAAASKSLR